MNTNNNKKEDKKEQILYRVVRIIFIFAIVWIIGTKFSGVSHTTEEGVAENQIEETTTDSEVEENVTTNEEFQIVDDTTIDTNQEIEELLGQDYSFRNDSLLEKHYEKHGKEMGFDSEADYEKAASEVINNPKSLHKYEKEDGDDVYYLENTKEFVIVSTDGYIRTYYYADKDYFDRQ